MKALVRFRAFSSTMSDFFRIARRRPLLFPLLLALSLAACLFVVVGVIEIAAPFVYTVF
jgi:hypothetical protein